MGLNLLRERFSDWLEAYGPDGRQQYLKQLEKHVGHRIDVNAWTVKDTAFPRLGSYTTYNIFRRCIQFLTEGDFGAQLEKDEEVDLEALIEFRAKLKPKSIKVPYA